MSRKPNPLSPDRRPWHPAPFSVDHVYAMQNLAKGEANEVQQKLALDFLINGLSCTYESIYFADNPRDTDFASGKRHVGLQIVKLVNMPRSLITKLREVETRRKREDPPNG